MQAFSGANNVVLNNSSLSLISGNMVYGLDPPRQHNTDRLREIADWLSSINFAVIQNETYSKCTPGTGDRFLRSDVFSNWLTKDNCALWAQGMPGAGKTFLASIVINHLQCLSAEPRPAIIYAYFRYNDQYSASDILASLVKQALEIHKDVPTDLEALYNNHRTTANTLSQERLAAVLGRLLEPFKKVYIVVDALDEMRGKARLELLKHLASLRVNLLLTSRQIDLPAELVRNPITISVESYTQKDIELFISASIQDSHYIDRVMQGDNSLRSKICTMVKEKCKGMFLAASLQIEALTNCTTKNELRKAAASLPSDMDAVYKTTIRRIKSQQTPHVSLAARAILWLTFAHRPLHVDELQHALAISSRKRTFDEDDMTPGELIISACCGLVVIDQESRTVRLAREYQPSYYTIAKIELYMQHEDYTAYDFFSQANYASGLFSEPHTFIATSCVRYLLAFGFTGAKINQWRDLQRYLKKGGLLRYAYDNWSFHAKRCYGESGLPPVVMAFVFQCPSYPIQIWPRRIEHFDPCQVAAYHGFLDVLQSTFRSHSRHITALTPLILSSRQGHQDIVQWLLMRQGLPERVQTGQALIYASVKCQEEIVRLILSRREIVAKEHLILALISASENGHERIVQMLLKEQDIDVNAHGSLAYIHASRNGHDAVVRLLLSCHELDVNAQGGQALAFASGNGHEKVVELLLARPDVDVNAGNGLSLIFASKNGHSSVLQLLLTRQELDLNAQDGQPLISAAENGWDQIVKILLSCPALNVDLRNGEALRRASVNEHAMIVDLLLSHQARQEG